MDQHRGGEFDEVGDALDPLAAAAPQGSAHGEEQTGQAGAGAKDSAGPIDAGNSVDAAPVTAGQPEVARAEQSWPPPSTVLTWQDLADLPGQLLPEEARNHLRNAGREALLALWSIWQTVDRSRKSGPDEKVRKHIDIE